MIVMHTNNIFMHGSKKQEGGKKQKRKIGKQQQRRQQLKNTVGIVGKKEMGAAQHDSREGIHFIPYPTVIIKV